MSFDEMGLELPVLLWELERALDGQSLAQCLFFPKTHLLVSATNPRTLAQDLGPPNCPTSTRCGAQAKAEALGRVSWLEKEHSRSTWCCRNTWRCSVSTKRHISTAFTLPKDGTCTHLAHQVSDILLRDVIGLQICSFSCFFLTQLVMTWSDGQTQKRCVLVFRS